MTKQKLFFIIPFFSHRKRIILITILISPTILLSQSTFEREIGGILPDYGISAFETKDFGFLICGTLYHNDGLNEDEIFLLKVDGEGNVKK